MEPVTVRLSMHRVGIMKDILFIIFAAVILGETLVVYCEAEYRWKVVILGAGISGITAAWTLEQQNITDFVVLEAEDYIGGRMKSVDFKRVVIETGANWIHSTQASDSSPLVKLKNQMNLNGKWSNYSDVVVR